MTLFIQSQARSKFSRNGDEDPKIRGVLPRIFPFSDGRRSAFTLLEIIMVISLFAFVYVVALPNLSMKSGTEVATKLGRLASDFRNAFDLAVLSNKTYRIVFNLSSGEYWLEVASRSNIRLGDKRVTHDPLLEEEEEKNAIFKDRMERYKEAAKDNLQDSESNESIPPTTPILASEDDLKPVKWSRVDTAEWSSRTIGPYLMIAEMQAEHHESKQVLGDLGEKGTAMIYVFPRGYVEYSYLKIVYKKGPMEADEEKKPIVFVTEPFAGTAFSRVDAEPVDVHQRKDEN